MRGIPRNCTFHYAILHLAPNCTLQNYSILHLTPFYTLGFARNCVLGYKALYLTPFYTLLHLRFYLIFVARYCAKLRVKTRKFSQLCAITFFQKKIDNFKSQLRQITTNILVKKNSFFITFFPYFWSLNKKKTVCTLLLAIARIYAQLHEFTPL